MRVDYAFYKRSEWGFRERWAFGADLAYIKPFGWAFVRVLGFEVTVNWRTR